FSGSCSRTGAARCLGPGQILSLTWTVLDQLVDLLLHRIEVEGRRILHRRIVDRRERQLLDKLLDQHEPPELACVEVVAVAERATVGRLAANARRALERILPNVDHAGHVGRGLLSGPAIGLLVELELEVIEPDSTEVRSAEVEHLMA